MTLLDPSTALGAILTGLAALSPPPGSEWDFTLLHGPFIAGVKLWAPLFGIWLLFSTVLPRASHVLAFALKLAAAWSMFVLAGDACLATLPAETASPRLSWQLLPLGYAAITGIAPVWAFAAAARLVLVAAGTMIEAAGHWLEAKFPVLGERQAHTREDAP